MGEGDDSWGTLIKGPSIEAGQASGDWTGCSKPTEAEAIAWLNSRFAIDRTTITIAPDEYGELSVCTNLAGEEVAKVATNLTPDEKKYRIAEILECSAGSIQLVGPDGQVIAN